MTYCNYNKIYKYDIKTIGIHFISQSIPNSTQFCTCYTPDILFGKIKNKKKIYYMS